MIATDNSGETTAPMLISQGKSWGPVKVMAADLSGKAAGSTNNSSEVEEPH